MFPMSHTIADALVVVFTYGVSLRTWLDTGGISRELALYEKLAPHYGKIILFTYGGPNDQKILDEALDPALRSKFTLVCNSLRQDTAVYSAAAPSLVRGSLPNAERVVVKTNQMAGGHVAARITQHLRSFGVKTGLVARGGYLWSRMTAYEHGPASKQAADAAAIERELCTAADVVVGTTQSMIDDLSWRYLIDASRTRLIPNYIIVPDGQTKTASERVPGLILYAGQLVRRKRVDVLIDAVGQLEPEIREKVTLEIVGDGPELESLSAQAQQVGAPVTFRGRLSHAELAARMNECSIYAQASELEGHPKTVLEAMAAGAPVVVANSTGLGDVVMLGATGLRVALEPEAFSRAIFELLNDADWRDVLGAGASRVMHVTLGLDATIPKEVECHQYALHHATAMAPALRMTM
jgi:glycosyltransferase involved in cell wall biosynthesis